MANEKEDDIVLVPVPRRHLAAVYRALAEDMGTSAATSAGQTTGVATTGATGLPVVPWTEADIKLLRTMIRTPTPRVILDMTTQRPGERVALEKATAKAGRTREQARAELAGLTQLIRRHFNRDNWPFKVEWAPGGYARYYCDSPEIARWWRTSSTA